MKVRFTTSFAKVDQLLLAALIVFAVPGVRAAEGEGLQPVTVKVVDRDRDVPLTDFEYRYSVDRGTRSRWTTNRSSAGTFVAQTPLSCELTVIIRAREFEAGQDVYRTFPSRLPTPIVKSSSSYAAESSFAESSETRVRKSP